MIPTAAAPSAKNPKANTLSTGLKRPKPIRPGVHPARIHTNQFVGSTYLCVPIGKATLGDELVTKGALLSSQVNQLP